VLICGEDDHDEEPSVTVMEADVCQPSLCGVLVDGRIAVANSDGLSIIDPRQNAVKTQVEGTCKEIKTPEGESESIV
jgi:hypothetical protein